MVKAYLHMGFANKGLKSLVLAFSICIILISSISGVAWAYTDTQIVNAIFKAEGGYRAEYLYGIRSVHYKDEAEARQICFNTVRNNRVRFAQQGKYKDYLDFLASRYCPINCDNDRGTNKYWLKNVKYFLARSK